jgi:putative FmdB family regulatory protein
MPIYEYSCKHCGHQFDLIQKMSDSPVQKCEKCGMDAERIISQTNFMLKGTGWYTTDYAGKKAHGVTSDSKSQTAKTASAKS